MKNSSEKINQTRTCKKIRYDKSACNRPLYKNDKHCIFHSEDVKKEGDDFNEAFRKEFERQKKEDKCYDFSRFIFPSDISFNEKKFDKNVYFDGAKFMGTETSFLRTQFIGEKTSFKDVQFMNSMTIFNGAQFAGKEISFENAQFTSEMNLFIAAQFTANMTTFANALFAGKNTFFGDAKFTGEWTIFNMAEFRAQVTSFQGVQFLGKENLFTGTKFAGETAFFNGAQFTGKVTFYMADFKNVWYLFESLTKRKWLLLKKYLIKDWRFYLQEETANRHPLVKRLVNDAWYLDEFKTRYPIAYFFWKILANCGRSWLLWGAWALGFAFGFGLIFMAMGPKAFDLRHDDTGFSFIYYSFVTFTTLGFGDITPTTLTAEILATIEVLLGYIMLGGLISILANKLARRS